MQSLALAQLGRQQIEHRGAAVGIMAGAEHPQRFVEQQGERGGWRRQRLAIDLDAVGGEIGLIAELRQLAIQPHPSLPQQLLAAAS